MFFYSEGNYESQVDFRPLFTSSKRIFRLKLWAEIYLLWTLLIDVQLTTQVVLLICRKGSSLRHTNFMIF